MRGCRSPVPYVIGSRTPPLRARSSARVLKFLGTQLKKGERSSLFRVLARTPFNSSGRPTLFSSTRTRGPPPRCGRLQARRRTELLPTIRLPSTCVWPFRRTPRAPRLDAMTRALRWSRARAALELPSRASSCPCSDQPMALSARACCAGGAAAKAARRAPHPAPIVVPRPAGAACPLSLDAQGGGGGGSGDRSYLCSTPSHCDGVMCDGVECVFAFPVAPLGGAPSGASVHAGSNVRCHRRLQPCKHA